MQKNGASRLVLISQVFQTPKRGYKHQVRSFFNSSLLLRFFIPIFFFFELPSVRLFL